MQDLLRAALLCYRSSLKVPSFWWHRRLQLFLSSRVSLWILFSLSGKSSPWGRGVASSSCLFGGFLSFVWFWDWFCGSGVFGLTFALLYVYISLVQLF